MALSKVDYNSLNVTAAASKALKWNSGADGFETGDVGGSLVLLETQTASGDATISFTSNIDDTYDEYVFKFYDIHPATDSADFQVNFRDGSSAYDATKTTTFFRAYHDEGDTATALSYETGDDVSGGTGVQKLAVGVGNDNDQSCSGVLHLFNPSSTTFGKHFMSTFSNNNASDYFNNTYIAGMCDVTVAIDGVQFSFSSGNIDAGVIKMYGVS